MLIKCQVSRVGHDLATEQARTMRQALGPGCLPMPNSPFRALQTLGSVGKVSQHSLEGGGNHILELGREGREEESMLK